MDTNRTANNTSAQTSSRTKTQALRAAFGAAWPVMVGYVFLGIPCGLLAQQIGLDGLQVFLLSMLFYSGAGQYMISNMWLAASPMTAIVASVTLVNSRQMLYGASLSRFCHDTKQSLSFLFGATVTDESFAVNLKRFEQGDWSVGIATLVNLMSQLSWAFANVIGVVLGTLLTVPTALASFAMTSIFLCLLFSQRFTSSTASAAIVAVMGVFVCKMIGLSGPAILIGACLGIGAGIIVSRMGDHKNIHRESNTCAEDSVHIDSERPLTYEFREDDVSHEEVSCETVSDQGTSERKEAPYVVE